MTDAGDLLAREEPLVLKVSALNQAVARLLEKSFPLAWVSGEISNFTRASSGHWYFTLKDEAAQVRAVMFRGRAQLAGFIPREGDKVEVRALVTLYAPRGDYQLNVEAIRRAGVGNLFEAFLRLKDTLEAEGLFDQGRKRPLPVFAKTVGIVTSPQAAALRDVLTALRRRAPHVQVVLYPAPVQGEGAAQKLAQAILSASSRRECDLLLVCRGGGSIEDLWSFNEEIVARAIAASDVPVIVGVGHESDFTIADFVADLRAPTPTAAAELAATPRNEWMGKVHLHAEDLTRALHRRLSDHGQSLDWMAHRLVSPAAYISRQRLHLRGLVGRFRHAMERMQADARHACAQLKTRMAVRLPDTSSARSELFSRSFLLEGAMRNAIEQRRHALAKMSAKLEVLNPQRTLERGYAILVDEKQRIVRRPSQLTPGKHLDVTLAKGSTRITVGEIQPRLEDI
jgi:exodeoxyribonuclease VII large subunit